MRFDHLVGIRWLKKIYKLIAKHNGTLLSFPMKRVPKINNKVSVN